METTPQSQGRPVEGMALVLIGVFLALVFFAASAGLNFKSGLDPLAGLSAALLPVLIVILTFTGYHQILKTRRLQSEQILFPVVCLLFSVGLVMVWRLRGPDGAWQQLLRGWIPGMVAAVYLAARPQAIERLHRWAVPISLIGLALPILTAIFGSVDETGARLAIKIGSLPAIQTSEPLKLVLIIFMAWFIDRQGRAAKGRDHVLFGWLHIPALRYFIPGVLFFLLAVLALTLMSDYGAVLILGGIFLAMLFAGFETRTFTSIILLGAMVVAILSMAFSFVWDVPTVVQYRFQAFQDPWSSAMIVVDGQPSGVTIAQGPGYQIQQAIYAVIAGGLSGSGLGFGSPDYVPLAHSDFILAAIVEEMGAVIGVAVLFLFAILLLRILRVSLRLPPDQIFERMLAVGIGAHLFTQVVLMAGGTLNLLPMTGVTIPFLSLGGMALLTNLAEIGLVFALIFRQEKAGQHD